MKYVLAVAWFKIVYWGCCICGYKYKTAPRLLEQAYNWQCAAFNDGSWSKSPSYEKKR